MIFKNIVEMPIAEIYLNSMNKDGTGRGYMMDLIDLLPKIISITIIISGGAGNYRRLAEGLDNKLIYEGATANILNFIGESITKLRENILISKICLAKIF